ncbi:TPA: hypothetical protein J1Z58_004333 [Escherichia coli]|nr:hypothetical protein [Escherichia coli]HBA7686238.1 hypothetical protein [Escherichia coli]HBA7856272.1 hypothetical protein [Escherichia coli]
MNVSSQNIDSVISGRYTVPAPYKAGAGGRSPELIKAIYDAPASFLSSALTHARIMVGWAGEPKGSPVSLIAGTANPVQFTTHEFRSSGGGSFSPIKEAAIMATVPTSPFLKIEVVNGKAVIFSLHVACHFKRMHQNIVDKIEYLNAKKPEHNSKNVVSGLVVWSSCSKLIWVEKKRLIAEFYQNIDSSISGRYTAPAPYKAGAGIGVLKFTEEHNRARAVFSCHEHCYAQIMVGRAGASQDAPGSSVTGYANPVRLTTSVIGVPCGECFKLTEGAVIMTTTTTHPFLKIESVNGKAVIFSLHVACHFKRMHQNIVDKIEYLNCSREFFTRNFIPGTYHIYGDSLRGYYITLDGLMMLQLGLSLRTMRYYESCIGAFHEAETSLNHTAFRRNQWEVRP